MALNLKHLFMPATVRRQVGISNAGVHWGERIKIDRSFTGQINERLYFPCKRKKK